jgi:diacylglycerol kinase family enzyme
MNRVSILINSDAGSVLEADRAAFTTRIVESFGQYGYEAALIFVAGPDLRSEFSRLAEDKNHLIVVAGGDGSLNAILPEAITTQALLAVLPLGTLNLMGSDLGLTGVIEDDVAAIAQGIDIECDAIMANDTFFHSNAGLGFFVTMAAERQAARLKFPFSKKFGFAWAAVRTILGSKKVEITYTNEDCATNAMADAVLVTNNRFFGMPWRRHSLNDGVMEMHLLRAPTLMQRLKVIVAVARGTWRDLECLTTFSVDTLTIRRPRRKVVRIALDGEIITLENPLKFVVLPGALRIRSGFPRGGVA